MPKYILTYFDLRGYGEYIRLLFTDNQIPFEDKRYTKEEWPQHKDKYPFQQIPVLNEDNKEIPQTGAILRHLARTHDLYGSSEDDKTFVDVIFDGLRDLRTRYAYIVYFAFDKKAEYVKEALPAELTKIEKLFKTHKNGEGFVIGDKISFVDYVLFEELDVALTTAPGCLDAFPALKGFHARFQERPNLKEYLATRNPRINNTDNV